MKLLLCLLGIHRYSMIGFEQYGGYGGYEHDEACGRCGKIRRKWTMRNHR